MRDSVEMFSLGIAKKVGRVRPRTAVKYVENTRRGKDAAALPVVVNLEDLDIWS